MLNSIFCVEKWDNIYGYSIYVRQLYDTSVLQLLKFRFYVLFNICTTILFGTNLVWKQNTTSWNKIDFKPEFS